MTCSVGFLNLSFSLPICFPSFVCFLKPLIPSNNFQIIHFVFWSTFPNLLSLSVPFTSIPPQGWEDFYLYPLGQIIFLLGNGLRGKDKKHLYFLLCFNFWLLITEFAVGNEREGVVLVRCWQQRSVKTCALVSALTQATFAIVCKSQF